MTDRKEKKRGRWKYKILNILGTKKNFLDEVKSCFHNYWRFIIWLKKRKIADTSFKKALDETKASRLQLSVNIVQ